MARRCGYSITWLWLAFGMGGPAPEAASPIDVRVGLLAYEDFREDLQFHEQLFSELERLWVPADAVIARSGFQHAQLLRTLLTRLRPEEFRSPDDGADRYKAVREWSDALALRAAPEAGQQVSLEIALEYLPWTPWSMLGGNHILHHAWLWCTFGMRWSAWCLLAVGLLGLAVRRIPAGFGPRLIWAGRWVTPVFWVGLLGLPLALVLTVLFCEETLSEGSGIERALAERFTCLIDGQLKRQRLASLVVDDAQSNRDRLRALSREIIERRNFPENAAAAFRHLYQRAQRVDVQSKEQVTVLTLAPQPPHLCVLDFADNLIDRAIAKGYREARGQAACIGQRAELALRAGRAAVLDAHRTT